MSKLKRARKVVDDTTFIRCLAGEGILREEVWQNRAGEVEKYNLAFINPWIYAGDNGRVLGYDNGHGSHHRHCKGRVEKFPFIRYDRLLAQFLEEVELLRKGEICD
jgi:hypothetical protein